MLVFSHRLDWLMTAHSCIPKQKNGNLDLIIFSMTLLSNITILSIKCRENVEERLSDFKREIMDSDKALPLDDPDLKKWVHCRQVLLIK